MPTQADVAVTSSVQDPPSDVDAAAVTVRVSGWPSGRLKQLTHCVGYLAVLCKILHYRRLLLRVSEVCRGQPWLVQLLRQQP